jgi:hypothetical protein
MSGGTICGTGDAGLANIAIPGNGASLYKTGGSAVWGDGTTPILGTGGSSSDITLTGGDPTGTPLIP